MAEIEIAHPGTFSLGDLVAEIRSRSTRSSGGMAFARVWRAASELIEDETPGVLQDEDGFSFTPEGGEAVLSWLDHHFGNEASGSLERRPSVRTAPRHRLGDEDALGKREGSPWDKNPELVRIAKKGLEAKRQLSNLGPDENPVSLDSLQKSIEEGEDALGELTQINEGLVGTIIHRKCQGWQGGLEFPDLLQAGRVGILQAVKRFDPDEGTKFSTYAWYWVLHEVERETANHGRTVRLPDYLQDKLSNMRRQEDGLRQALGREPTAEELAEAMEFPVEKVEEMKVWSRWPVSLHTPVSYEDGETELIDSLPDQEATLPEPAAEQNILGKEIGEVLDTLLPREQKVLGLLFGTGGQGSHTETEVAEMLGKTRQKVHQIKTEALDKLVNSPHADRLKEWL